MRKILIAMAMMLGSQLFAQEEPKSILEFANDSFNTEVTIPIAKDTVLYVDAPVEILNLTVDAHRVDNDPEGVFSFYKVGKFSVMEAKMNDGRTFFSVMRK